jgi:hypothetical protein
VKTLIPRHIQEAESDRRSIKEGWYAINKTGQVCSGRFPDREDCQAHIALQPEVRLAIIERSSGSVRWRTRSKNLDEPSFFTRSAGPNNRAGGDE